MSTDGEKRRLSSRLANAQGSCRLGPKYRLSKRVYSARTGQPLTAAYLFAPNSYRIAKLVRDAGYRSAEKNGEWLTLSEAAAKLGVSHHRMRALVKAGVVIAEQVMRGAPHQIRASDLDDQRVGAFLDGAGRPRRGGSQNQTSMFSDT